MTAKLIGSFPLGKNEVEIIVHLHEVDGRLIEVIDINTQFCKDFYDYKKAAIEQGLFGKDNIWFVPTTLEYKIRERYNDAVNKGYSEPYNIYKYDFFEAHPDMKELVKVRPITRKELIGAKK